MSEPRQPVTDPRTAYARAGVDVAAGEQAVELMRASVASTRRPEVSAAWAGSDPPWRSRRATESR